MRLPFFLLVLINFKAAAETTEFVMPPKREFKSVVSEFSDLVSPDGSLYATGDRSGVNVWKFGDTRPLAHIAWPITDAEFGRVLPRAISKDNKLIVISRTDTTTLELAVADIETETILGATRPRPVRYPKGKMTSWVRPENYFEFYVSPDNEKISAKSNYQVKDGVDRIEEIVFTPAGKILETKSWENLKIGDEWVDENVKKNGVCYRSVAGGPSVAVRIDAGSCAVLSCETNKRLSYLDECDASKVKNVRLSNDGSRVFGESQWRRGYEPTVIFWDAATGKMIRTIELKPEQPYRLASSGYAVDVGGRFFALKGQYVAEARVQSIRLDLLSIDSGERLGRIETTIEPGKDPRLSAVAPDGSAAYMFTEEKDGRGVMSFWRFGAAQPVAAPVAVAPPAPSRPAFDVDHAPKALAAVDPNAYAIVIGVEKYRQAGIPAVNYAARDAKAVYAYLTQSMGFDAKNVVALTDGEATKTDFEKHFGKWLANRVDAKSRVFIYYAGHGAPNPTTGEAYLMPYEADPSYLDDTAYPIARLYSQLAKLPTRDVTVVLDACFSGQGQRSLVAAGTRPLVVVKTAQAPQNLTVIAAASGTQISASDPLAQHGLLTYHLLAGLRGDADKNKDGRITADEAFAYAKPAVERAARLQNVEQVPSISGGDETLARRPWIVFDRAAK